MMRGSSGAQPELTVGGVQAAYEVAANPEAFAERLLRLAGAVREAEKAKAEALAEQAVAREAMAAVEAGNAKIAGSEKALADRDRHLSNSESALAQDRARFEAEHKIKTDALDKRTAAAGVLDASLTEREEALSAYEAGLKARKAAATEDDGRLKTLAADLEAKQTRVVRAQDAVLAWLTNIRSDMVDALDDMPDPGSLGYSGESEEGMIERIAGVQIVAGDVSREMPAAPKSKGKKG